MTDANLCIFLQMLMKMERHTDHAEHWVLARLLYYQEQELSILSLGKGKTVLESAGVGTRCRWPNGHRLNRNLTELSAAYRY